MLLHAHAHSYTPYSINVTWSDINVNQTTLYMYYIYYRLLDVQLPTWSVKGFPTTGPNELIDLQPGTSYGVRVMAAMESGNGIATEELKLVTMEGCKLIQKRMICFEHLECYKKHGSRRSWVPQWLGYKKVKLRVEY